MNVKSRSLVVFLWAFAVFMALAPVCVFAGGDSQTVTQSIELSDGARIEVVGENAEVRIHGVASSAIEISVTMNNEDFIDFYTQVLYGSPASHLVISATMSKGSAITANSLIEIGVPAGIELIVRTTNRSIKVEGVSVATAILATTDGPITVVNSSGDFDLNTTNSDVTVRAIDGPVNVVTTNGHVWLEGVIDEGSNSISTTNGDITVRLKSGSNVSVSGNTRNGDVTINGSSDGVTKDGAWAWISHRVDDGTATLHITNGPGAIHINPMVIALFDGES